MTTASPLEIGWTAVAALGEIAALLLLTLAVLDLVAVVRSHENGNRRRYARKAVREALRKVLTFAVLLFVGGVALVTPPPVHPDNQRAALLSGVAFAVLNLYLTADTCWTIVDEYAVRFRLWFYDRAFPPDRPDA